MSRYSWWDAAPAVLIGALAMPSASMAALPSPANSSVPACIAVCPAGDLSFDVVVRDLANNPITNALVWIEFINCPILALCAPCADTYIVEPTASRLSKYADQDGRATFSICGGVCAGASINIYADGVRLHGFSAQRPLSSPDQDGDLVVDAGDVATIQANEGSFTHLSSDLDCSGRVDSEDAQLAQTHFGHACSSPTKAGTRTWGQLKILHR